MILDKLRHLMTTAPEAQALADVLAGISQDPELSPQESMAYLQAAEEAQAKAEELRLKGEPHGNCTQQSH